LNRVDAVRKPASCCHREQSRLRVSLEPIGERVRAAEATGSSPSPARSLFGGSGRGVGTRVGRAEQG
jgi:hypothetical protein